MADPTFYQVLRWNEEECRDYLESKRWPDGVPVCPKCGSRGPYVINRKNPGKNKVTKLYRCKNTKKGDDGKPECGKQYTATVGTIFEDSKIPLNIWFAAIHQMCSSKKGVSANQIHRELGIDLKSAWFLCHRVREAMKDKMPSLLTGVVEADETYVGGKLRGHPNHRKTENTMRDSVQAAFDKRTQVVGVVERGGRVRAKAITTKGKRITRPQVEGFLLDNLNPKNTLLFTDEYAYYDNMSKHLPHGVIRHKSEYVRGTVHTNTIESYWAILKRGLYGTFHHVDAGYLGQYLNEFEFRYNARTVSDAERFAALMGQTQGRVTWFCQTPQPENPYA